MDDEPHPDAYQVEPGDRVAYSVGYASGEGTVVETVEDHLGYGIVLEKDSGEQQTIGPEQFEGRI